MQYSLFIRRWANGICMVARLLTPSTLRWLTLSAAQRGLKKSYTLLSAVKKTRWKQCDIKEKV
jgi:hypothetical protein